MSDEHEELACQRTSSPAWLRSMERFLDPIGKDDPRLIARKKEFYDCMKDLIGEVPKQIKEENKDER